jgi:sensor domain CHASE-containing protein
VIRVPVVAKKLGDTRFQSIELVAVDSQRLYNLVELPQVGEHELELEFEPGITAYAFTFG